MNKQTNPLTPAHAAAAAVIHYDNKCRRIDEAKVAGLLQRPITSLSHASDALLTRKERDMLLAKFPAALRFKKKQAAAYPNNPDIQSWPGFFARWYEELKTLNKEYGQAAVVLRFYKGVDSMDVSYWPLYSVGLKIPIGKTLKLGHRFCKQIKLSRARAGSPPYTGREMWNSL